jgi:methylmalonyl-CoA mutase N-terminal domain/subunit
VAAPRAPTGPGNVTYHMATADENRTIAPIVGPDDPRHFTDSGIEINPLYDERDLPENLGEKLGEPGEYPYTRGVHREMYRKQLWTMRQYAGYASAKESNERYRYLLSKGSTGLSMAFDLPTQLGLDSDDPRCLGEVGRTGVAIDSIDDMRTAFDQIPLDQVSTSMTINAPASVLLLLYELVGEEQGVEAEQLRGTTQNDILKEYIARGNYIYPPEGAIRLTTDLFAYCNERIPRWNTVSISGYHFREKGCSAVQEVAFTLANGIAYVQAALDAGLEIDRFAPRLAFFFNGHNNVFQEVAKFRAARRMWANIMRERFGAQDERSWRLRFHTQTGGVTLTAQQPENNIVRVALQGFAAVCGGTQSLHTNGFDEALALPTERAAKIALRTQQIIGYESGAADTVDPFAGSYFVEALTDEIETRAQELIDKVDQLGGAVHAIAFMTAEIEESAFGYHERYRTEQDIVVGVNKFVEDTPEVPDILRVDPESEHEQVARLKAFKADRDQDLVQTRLSEVRTAAEGTDNLLPALRQALKDRCSVGEVCGAMRDVFGDYRPTF